MYREFWSNADFLSLMNASHRVVLSINRNAVSFLSKTMNREMLHSVLRIQRQPLYENDVLGERRLALLDRRRKTPTLVVHATDYVTETTDNIWQLEPNISSTGVRPCLIRNDSFRFNVQISLSQMHPPDLISESLRRARRLPQLRRGEPRALVALFGARADGRHE